MSKKIFLLVVLSLACSTIQQLDAMLRRSVPGVVSRAAGGVLPATIGVSALWIQKCTVAGQGQAQDLLNKAPGIMASGFPILTCPTLQDVDRYFAEIQAEVEDWERKYSRWSEGSYPEFEMKRDEAKLKIIFDLMTIHTRVKYLPQDNEVVERAEDIKNLCCRVVGDDRFLR